MNFIIASSALWNKEMRLNLEKKLNVSFYFIDKEENLTIEILEKIKPKYIFFPHWSYIIPIEIFMQYECVIFHMTDLPFGRGGSPLQNLISRGIYETQISALKCIEELDAGPIYMKLPLNLYGNAEEIYIRAGKIIEKMIEFIILHDPVPVEQKGESVSFKRRKPEESNIELLDNLESVFNFIRMLDAKGYPNAYIETKNLKFEFSRASLKVDHIIADVKITERNDTV